MQYSNAIKIANRLHELFTPHCIITHIAGSIRRQRNEVNDIELVCLPRYEFVKLDLFGNGEWRLSQGYKQVINLISERIIKGQQGGRYMQIQLKKTSLLLDLFTPQSTDYYRILAIRTGSADYSHLRLAAQWTKLGWCGTHDGLRLIKECIQTASGWKCTTDRPTLPPEWESEEQFFQWLQIPWIEPIYREINKHQKTFFKENL